MTLVWIVIGILVALSALVIYSCCVISGDEFGNRDEDA